LLIFHGGLPIVHTPYSQARKQPGLAPGKVPKSNPLGGVQSHNREPAFVQFPNAQGHWAMGILHTLIQVHPLHLFPTLHPHGTNAILPLLRGQPVGGPVPFPVHLTHPLTRRTGYLASLRTIASCFSAEAMYAPSLDTPLLRHQLSLDPDAPISVTDAQSQEPLTYWGIGFTISTTHLLGTPGDAVNTLDVPEASPVCTLILPADSGLIEFPPPILVSPLGT
jgi:hypothetical protein